MQQGLNVWPTLHVCHACCNTAVNKETLQPENYPVTCWQSDTNALYQQQLLVDLPAKHIPILLDQEFGKVPGDRAGITTSCLQYRSHSKLHQQCTGKLWLHQPERLVSSEQHAIAAIATVHLPGGGFHLTVSLSRMMQRRYTHTGKWERLRNDKLAQARHPFEAIHGSYGVIYLD